MAFRVTQCPSCESTFNTSHRLLEAAEGKVRCGACLTVFSAADNFIADDPAQEQESVFVSAAPVDYFDPAHFITRSALRDTDGHTDVKEPESPSNGETLATQEKSEPSGISLHLRFTLAATDAPRAPARGPDPTEFSLAYSGQLRPPDGEADEAPDRESSEEVESQAFRENVASDKADRSTETDESIAAIRARALQAELEDEEALERIPRENLTVLTQFTSPVEFFAGKSRRWQRQAGWTGLTLILGFTLTGQYLWQEMAIYSQSPRLRPLYEWLCGLAPCELPAYSDIAAIRSDFLTVRSHPQLDNALAINIEFRNTAPFPQPFPIMVLSFNAADDAVMALREFAPAEYLNGALARREMMPVMNPVQVNLEIIDPGPDAVNYTLAFRSP